MASWSSPYAAAAASSSGAARLGLLHGRAQRQPLPPPSLPRGGSGPSSRIVLTRGLASLKHRRLRLPCLLRAGAAPSLPEVGGPQHRQRRHQVGHSFDARLTRNSTIVERILVMLIGNTPMVISNNIVKGSVANVAAKLEIMEPCCKCQGQNRNYSMIKRCRREGPVTPERSA
ncbi:hypothetical protein HU200_013836 [Digitaria exilis]|uniref:Uncharacterized protein n=1 Tax=Digitaria exilis TaxID=1010633 RepID=A0A835FCX8_9POAL|nr:hypothetical protein HU200_013836 [Digitaria exilis]